MTVVIYIILELLSFTIFTLCGIRASIEDIKTQTIPRNLSIFCLVAVLLFHTTALTVIYYDIASSSFFQQKFWEPARGAFIAFMLFEVVRILTKKQLGFADVLWAAIGGALIGAIWWLSGAFLACIGGLIHFLFQKEDHPLPFIPFLCVSTAFMWILKVIHLIVTYI